MNKHLLIFALSLLTTTILYPMGIKRTEITNGSIDEDVIENDFIVRGKCLLNHDIIIKGRLLIAKNAILVITSEGTFNQFDKASVRNIKSPISKDAIAICGLKMNNLIFEDESSTIRINGIVEFNLLDDIYFPTGTLIIAPNSALKLTACLGINPQLFPLTIYRTPDFLLRIFDTAFIYENNVAFFLGSPFKNEDCEEL